MAMIMMMMIHADLCCFLADGDDDDDDDGDVMMQTFVVFWPITLTLCTKNKSSVTKRSSHGLMVESAKNWCPSCSE